MKKTIKFQCTLPQQCFPGRAGWEFLPAGYSGSYYAYVSQIYSKYNHHGHGGRKLFANAESAILDILPEMQSRGILEMAVRLPDKSWVSIRSDGKVKDVCI